jgi:hypothetical protein
MKKVTYDLKPLCSFGRVNCMSEIPEVIIEIFANNPPSILFALGFVLLLIGYLGNYAELVGAGWVFVILGVVLQILWLILRR